MNVLQRILFVVRPLRRTQQCGVKYVWAVSGGKHYYAFVYRKAVHLHQ